jgi:hypothetical protein
MQAGRKGTRCAMDVRVEIALSDFSVPLRLTLKRA